MSVGSFALELFPGRTLQLLLVKDATGSAEIRKRLLSGELDASVLNARMVLDVFQVIAAANKALLGETQQKLKTNSLHSELVLALSGSRSIGDAYRKFGITDKSDYLLLGKFNTSAVADEKEAEAIGQELAALAREASGTVMPLSQIAKDVDDETLKVIKKAYAITPLELQSSSVLDAIVTKIALKDAL